MGWESLSDLNLLPYLYVKVDKLKYLKTHLLLVSEAWGMKINLWEIMGWKPFVEGRFDNCNPQVKVNSGGQAYMIIQA